MLLHVGLFIRTAEKFKLSGPQTKSCRGWVSASSALKTLLITVSWKDRGRGGGRIEVSNDSAVNQFRLVRGCCTCMRLLTASAAVNRSSRSLLRRSCVNSPLLLSCNCMAATNLSCPAAPAQCVESYAWSDRCGQRRG